MNHTQYTITVTDNSTEYKTISLNQSAHISNRRIVDNIDIGPNYHTDARSRLADLLKDNDSDTDESSDDSI